MRWNSLTPPSMRQESCGTSGVSTETIRLLRWAPWVMWSMSMPMPAPFACGAANRRGAATKPAPRPKVFLRKSRLFFMVLPFKELADPTARENPWALDRGEIHGQAIDIKVAAVISPLEREGKNQMRRTLKEAVYAGCG